LIDFQGFFDKKYAKLERYAKQEWTQLQFIFELKDGEVETSYRAYASDDVIELVSKDNFMTINGRDARLHNLLASRIYNMVPINTKVNTFTLSQKTVFFRDDDGHIKV